ncbi:hypothetical protein Taro_017115 [Colocasia esculenta]|uniref:Uncharacterized protein n=1 Tax=Colocasia esculenta TaxID=4460 RepID=A0A843UQC2_COLES|nr:hypothetical protein [Colocasia esculenta]
MRDYRLFHSPNQARSLQDVFMKVVHDNLLTELQLESHQTGQYLFSTQAKIHERLLSSGRPEDGKEVPSIISRTEENATASSRLSESDSEQDVKDVLEFT